jgi:hypothetical protein
MRHPTLSKIAMGIAATGLLLSCSILESSAFQGSDTSIPGKLDAVQTLEDPRVEEVYALRSVQMMLETAFSGKTPNRTVISIDAEGNQKIELPVPRADGSVDPSGANVLEIFVISGTAYSRMGKEGSAEADPSQDNALHEILYGPTGPGLWLMLLPKDAFTSVGMETKGGFKTQRYSVEGSIEDGLVRGEIWVDKQTGALVGADLSISESLFQAEGSGTSGSVSIILTVEKAEIPAITLP